MSNPLRIRLNLSVGEYEFEGAEETVREMLGELPRMLREIAGSPTHGVPAATLGGGTGALSSSAEPPAEAQATFGELMHEYPGSITDIDRMLIAGSFVQQQSQDNSFSTRDANDLLKEQAIKLANPSVCVKRNTDARRLFSVGQGRFRISQTGLDYLRQLKTSADVR